jgi:hypothetical protein
MIAGARPGTASFRARRRSARGVVPAAGRPLISIEQRFDYGVSW